MHQSTQNITINTDCYQGMQKLADNSVHACITSPPYWRLRDYEVPPSQFPECSFTLMGMPITIPAWTGCYGLEPTPEMFIAHTVLYFKEVYRILRPDGVLYLNIGDSYFSTATGNPISTSTLQGGMDTQINAAKRPEKKNPSWAKTKDLVGIPYFMALALREAGWYWRSDIIWDKKTALPESVKDRCTKIHEYVFQFSKTDKYYWDWVAIATESSHPVDEGRQNKGRKSYPDKTKNGMRADGVYPIANRRTIWRIAPEQNRFEHYAAFPQQLAADCIASATSEKCCAACGAPYYRQTEKKLVPTGKAAHNFVVDDRDKNVDEQDAGSNRQKDGHKNGWAYQVITTGWAKKCKCDTEDTIPATVLDPFGGTGTTGLVAAKLGRSSILFEIKPEYCQINSARTHREQGLFNTSTIKTNATTT